METIDYKENRIRMEMLLRGDFLLDDINPRVFKTEQVHISKIKPGDLIINMHGGIVTGKQIGRAHV